MKDSLDSFSSFGINSFGFIPLFQEIASALMSHEPGNGKRFDPTATPDFRPNPYRHSSSMERQRRRDERWNSEERRDSARFQFISLFEPELPYPSPPKNKVDYGPSDFYLGGKNEDGDEKKEEEKREEKTGEPETNGGFQEDTPDPPFSPRLPPTPSKSSLPPKLLLCDEASLEDSDDDSDNDSSPLRHPEAPIVKETFNLPLSLSPEELYQELKELKLLVTRLNAHNEILEDRAREMGELFATINCHVSDLTREVKDFGDRLAVQEQKVWDESSYRVLYNESQGRLKNYITNYQKLFNEMMFSTPTPASHTLTFSPRGGKSKK